MCGKSRLARPAPKNIGKHGLKDLDIFDLAHTDAYVIGALGVAATNQDFPLGHQPLKLGTTPADIGKHKIRL